MRDRPAFITLCIQPKTYTFQTFCDFSVILWFLNFFRYLQRTCIFVCFRTTEAVFCTNFSHTMSVYCLLTDKLSLKLFKPSWKQATLCPLRPLQTILKLGIDAQSQTVSRLPLIQILMSMRYSDVFRSLVFTCSLIVTSAFSVKFS